MTSSTPRNVLGHAIVPDTLLGKIFNVGINTKLFQIKSFSQPKSSEQSLNLRLRLLGLGRSEPFSGLELANGRFRREQKASEGASRGWHLSQILPGGELV